MSDFPADIQPLAGGMSGETWLTEVAGERAVLRIYSGRSRQRGPSASETDAAVLSWLAGLLPVPRVLEVRRGDPDADLPALLVTSYLPGVLLEDLLPTLDDEGLRRVGHELGTLLGRIAHVALPRAGLFHDHELGLDPMPEPLSDLTRWVDYHEPNLTGWTPAELTDLRDLARAADLFALVDLASRESENAVAQRATALLRVVASTGDLHATP
jgi:hypothetical protein